LIGLDLVVQSDFYWPIFIGRFLLADDVVCAFNESYRLAIGFFV